MEGTLNSGRKQLGHLEQAVNRRKMDGVGGLDDYLATVNELPQGAMPWS